VVRVGIAGLGQAGAALVAPVARHPGMRLVAAADPHVEAVQALAGEFGVEAHADVASLCASPAVDLVCIATPSHLHAAHALLALHAGKHVIVEKPLAVTLAEAGAMIALAERAGLALIVGHSQSFEPPIRAFREVVASGELGSLRMLHTWNYGDWVYRPRTPEELETSLGGGVLFRQGAHQVDLIRWIAGGLVRSVRATLGTWDRARPVQGSHVLLLEFEDGVAATLVYSGYDHFQSVELTSNVGERGLRAPLQPAGSTRARLLAGDEAEMKRAFAYTGTTAAALPEHASTYGLTIVSCDRGDIRQVPKGLRVYDDRGGREIPVGGVPTGRDLLLDEAYAAVALGKAPAHDGRWGRANLEVCLAALRSARTGRTVRVRRQVPTPV
jgi:phthalate 4,5-cis-dihydrodiol dehydrogenase